MNNAWLITPRVGLLSSLRPSTCRILPPLFTLSLRQLEACRAFSLTRSQFLPRPQKPPKKPAAAPNHAAARGQKARSPSRNSSISIGAADIRELFGEDVELEDGKAIIIEIQKRRREGSLIDIGLRRIDAEDVTMAQKMAALEWLRQKYPMHESAAAERYAAAEEKKYRDSFQKRALNSWFYKKKEGVDPDLEDLPERERFEKGVDKWKHMKEAQRKEQQMEIVKLEKEYKIEQQDLALRAVQYKIDIAEKRDEKLMQWDKLEKTAQLETEKILDEKRSAFSRLGGPVAFASVVTIVALLLLNRDEVHPIKKTITDHLGMPPSSEFTKPSAITCYAITAINLVIWLVWRHPRAWWYMNRYFMLSAGDPKTFSLLGAVFSHQQWVWHLAMNSTLLFGVGMPLHDEIGRQNFLATYIGCGLFANGCSLAFHVLRRNFIFVSIGASGALSGILATHLTIDPQKELKVPFVKEPVAYNGQFVLALLVAFEVFGFVRARMRIDHVTHLGGLMAGALFGWLLRPNREANSTTTHEEIINTTAEDVQ